ncbi:transposase [Spirosoma montaniterrae]|uniref:Transposase n=1 Tax=Spirosoma montaniterrae TaxID=1178516 RepID=A0A1P9WYJ7_9BACT|nr:transposase [Spirosoma montaniterrae]AQG80450.1 transposase [Spirosoma montaniterrae]
MTNKHSYLTTALLMGVLLTGCGGNKEEEKTEEASVSATGAVDAMKAIADQAEEMQKNGPVETVDFRALKELLPADADGLTRKEATGEKNKAMGFGVSTATGKYGNDDNSETIEIALVDGAGSAMMMGLAAWSMIEVDKETADGYEKTTTIGGNKAFEKYDNSSKSGEVAVLVNKRYIVTAKGRGVGIDKIKAALEDVDMNKLAELK